MSRQIEHRQLLLDNLKPPDFPLLWTLPSQSSLSQFWKSNSLGRVRQPLWHNKYLPALPMTCSPERERGGGLAQPYFAPLLEPSLQLLSNQLSSSWEYWKKEAEFLGQCHLALAFKQLFSNQHEKQFGQPPHLFLGCGKNWCPLWGQRKQRGVNARYRQGCCMTKPFRESV